MKRLIAIGVALGAMTLYSLPVYANSTGTPGQPSQSCQSFFGDAGPFTPKGFNTAGFNHATTVYAGAQSQNSNNPKSVSQYDVACFQAASH
ncbi:MAG TPA: adenylate cyclase [Clostridia bacterium]|nr:adenylate cyclase [Clostridia bacterium]